MPELPEVHTTVTILDKLITGKTITDTWSDYNSPFYRGKNQIKDPAYFATFRKALKNKKIVGVYRRGKNVLIDLKGGQTVLIHMKMTGNLLYNNEGRFTHLRLTFKDGSFLALNDMRKFATVTLLSDKEALERVFAKVGPEPLEKGFDLNLWKQTLLRRSNAKVKTVLMDPKIVAGIGNIYSDEILWASSIHPEKIVSKLTADNFRDSFYAMKMLLSKGIDFGGDSMSDYLNPYGEKGSFQLHHEAYRRTGEKCRKRGCKGLIIRKVVNGRSAHFCNKHQKLEK